MILDLICVIISIMASGVSILTRKESFKENAFEILSKRYLDTGKEDKETVYNEVVSMMNIKN